MKYVISVIVELILKIGGDVRLKKGIAIVIDLVFCYFAFGLLIGLFTGQLTGDSGEIGFKLKGFSIIIFLVSVALYFILTKKFFKATLAEKLLRVKN